MASVHRRGKRGIYTAMWRDATGRLWSRTTKQTDRKAAQKMADEWERVAEMPASMRTMEQMQRVIHEMHRTFTGRDLVPTTLRGFVDAWMVLKKAELSETSAPAYEAATGSLCDWLASQGRGEVLLSEVSRADLLAWRDARRVAVSGSTTNKNLKIIRSLFRQAKSDMLIAENPAEAVKLVKVRAHERQKPVPFTEQQIRDVLAECDAEWLSMVVHAYYTGQRLADIAMLRQRDVDPVKRQVTLLTGKTGKQIIIEMPEAYLSWHLSQESSDDREAYLHPVSADTLLRTKRSGTLSNRFAKILERAGLRKESDHKKAGDGRSARRTRKAYTFHGLRHSMVTHLAQRGVARSLVQDLVGHDSAAVNANYTQFDGATKRAAMETLENITRRKDRQLSFLGELEDKVKRARP